MKRYLLCVSFCLWYAVAGLHAQEREEILKCRDFQGTALYGYMNGGSDLYYEYGFENLRVTELEFTFPGEEGRPVTEKYTIERYKTATPAGAFGLYSVHVNKFLHRDMYGLDCLTRYQLQACLADIYLSIVFENPTERAKQGALLLYEKFRDSTAGKAGLSIPEQVKACLLNDGETEDVLSGELKLIRGQIALNNSLQDLYPAFDGFESFDLWVTEPAIPAGTAYKAVIFFPCKEACDRFVEQNSGRVLSDDFAPPEIKELQDHAVLLILRDA